MKKIFSLILLVSFALSANAQRYMSITQTDGSVLEIALNKIDSIHFFVKDNTIDPPVVNPDNPVENGHEYVDLGLPSGTLWATCNVGADSPTDYGDYFAWGETKPKSTYKLENYKWYTSDTTVDKDGIQTIANHFTKYITGEDSEFVDNITTLELADDAAHVNWGGAWRMPTLDELLELCNYCNWESAIINDVVGCKVSSKVDGNTNYIFLPAAGMIHPNWGLTFTGSSGDYWSSSLQQQFPDQAYYIRIQDGGAGKWNNFRYYGRVVRPVCPATPKTYTIAVEADATMGSVTGAGVYEKGETVTLIATANDGYVFTGWSDQNTDNPRTLVATADITLTALFEEASQIETNGHEYVDLGLPSGTLWATCNVGAESPEEYGDYFAWGETTTKSTYDWSTYKYCNGTSTTMTKYCTNSSYGTVDNKTTLESADDAATVNWGGDWRTPTTAEYQELSDECTWNWTTLNGVNGYRVTGKNGNSIFLPAAGSLSSSYPYLAGSYGYYWSSSLRSAYPYDACDFDFDSDEHYTDRADRYVGQSVRPVCSSTLTEKPDNANQTITVNGVSFNMIAVEGGTFTMGATDEQGNDAESIETPAHQVTLSDYYIGETEVTQALWYAVMGERPTVDGNQWTSSYGLGDEYPAYYISWNDCQEFITKLNALTGKNFRMPTEAEWEYAARGGNKSKGYKYSGSNTIDDVAWYSDNSGSTSHTVGIKVANELGIYDMAGNVWEWCSDWHSSYSSSAAQTNPTGPNSGYTREVRGGNWDNNAQLCRVSCRRSNPPSGIYSEGGLRLVLVP